MASVGILEVPLASLIDLSAVSIHLKHAFAVVSVSLHDEQFDEALLMMKKLLETWLQLLNLAEQSVRLLGEHVHEHLISMDLIQ